jgi:hypothetical protein
MRYEMKKLMLSTVAGLALFLSGCCTNYGIYVRSIDEDLKSLTPMVEGYVNSDERLSEADRLARLAVLREMQAKTDVAKKDVE